MEMEIAHQELGKILATAMSRYRITASKLAKLSGISNSLLSILVNGGTCSWDTWGSIFGALSEADLAASDYFWINLPPSHRDLFRDDPQIAPKVQAYIPHSALRILLHNQRI
jgi:hypothetical protein